MLQSRICLQWASAIRPDLPVLGQSLWHDDVRVHQSRKFEMTGKNADDSDLAAVDRDRALYYGRVPGKPVMPQAVTQQGDARRIRKIFLMRKLPSDQWPDPKCVQKSRFHQCTAQTQRMLFGQIAFRHAAHGCESL